MTIARYTSAVLKTLTVTKTAQWVQGDTLVLDWRLHTSTGETLPKWLARAIGDLAPCGSVTVDIYPDGARLKHVNGWIRDVGKPGRLK